MWKVLRLKMSVYKCPEGVTLGVSLFQIQTPTWRRSSYYPEPLGLGRTAKR